MFMTKYCSFILYSQFLRFLGWSNKLRSYSTIYMNSSVTVFIITINTNSCTRFLADEAVLFKSFSVYLALDFSVLRTRYKWYFWNPLYTLQVRPIAWFLFSHYTFKIITKLASNLISLLRLAHYMHTSFTTPTIEFILKCLSFIKS